MNDTYPNCNKLSFKCFGEMWFGVVCVFFFVRGAPNGKVCTARAHTSTVI